MLRVDGHDVMYTRGGNGERCSLTLGRRTGVRLSDVFDDAQALFYAVVQHGLEGVVAKRRNGIYPPGYRGWTKFENAGWWRRAMEVEVIQRRGRRYDGCLARSRTASGQVRRA